MNASPFKHKQSKLPTAGALLSSDAAGLDACRIRLIKEYIKEFIISE